MLSPNPFPAPTMSESEINALRVARGIPPLDNAEKADFEEACAQAIAEVLMDEDHAAIVEGVSKLPGGFWRVIFLGPRADPVEGDVDAGVANIFLKWQSDDCEPVFVIRRSRRAGGKFVIGGPGCEPEDAFQSAGAALTWLGHWMMSNSGVQHRP